MTRQLPALPDARNTPPCRAMGRAWWKQFGHLIAPARYWIGPNR